jgi:hypothetical protein
MQAVAFDEQPANTAGRQEDGQAHNTFNDGNGNGTDHGLRLRREWDRNKLLRQRPVRTKRRLAACP